MSFYAGLAAGWNQGQTAHNQKLFDLETEKNKNMATMYAHLADKIEDPELRNEMINQSFQYNSASPFEKRKGKQRSFEDIMNDYHQKKVSNYQSSLLPQDPSGKAAMAPTAPEPLPAPSADLTSQGIVRHPVQTPAPMSAPPAQQQPNSPPNVSYDPSGMQTMQSKMQMDAYAMQAKLDSENTAKLDAMKKQVDVLRHQFPNLSERDLVSLAMGHSMPTTPVSRTQKTAVFIKQPDGSEVQGVANYDPLAISRGESPYTDDNGQPVQVSRLAPTRPNSGMESKDRAHRAYALNHYGDENHPLTAQEELQAEQASLRMMYPGTAGAPTPIMDPNNPLQGRFVPASQAYGQVPMATPTMYDLSGIGQTAGQPYTKTPPPNVPAEITNTLIGWELHNQQANMVLDELTSYKGRLGPAWGRVAGLQLSKLGGWGTSPEEKTLAVDLENLLTYKAFAEGGKQLTGPELERFKRLLPDLADTVENAVIKTQKAITYANEVRQIKYKNLPPRTRNQLTPPSALGGPPKGRGKIPRSIAIDYINKNGGDRAKGMAAAVADGWDVEEEEPPKVPKK